MQELKEMTRSRLAAEATGDRVSDTGSSMKSKSKVSKDRVRRMARDTHDCGGTLLQNIRERLRLDVSTRQKLNPSLNSTMNSSESSSPSHSGFSCETNVNRDNKTEQFENAHMYQVAQHQSFLQHSPTLGAQDPTTLTQRHHDHLLGIHNSYSNDAFDNSSVHSLNSGIESDYLGSENACYPSSYSVHRQASYPVAADFHGASENRDARHNTNVFGGNLLGLSDCSSRSRSFTRDEYTPYAPAVALQKNDSFQSSPGSLVSSHSFTRVEKPVAGADGFYCGIIGQGSLETEPTINLSDSFCGSEENNAVPLHFGGRDRNVSDGVIFGNGDLPNSVAESVLMSRPIFSDEAKRNSFSAVFRDSHSGHHNTHYGRYKNNLPCQSLVEPTNLGSNVICRKSSDESDDVSKSHNSRNDPNNLTKFLDDFELRMSFSCPEVPSSSFFVSKIDPEVMKHHENNVPKSY